MYPCSSNIDPIHLMQVEILAHEVKQLKIRVPLVKVLWCNHRVEQATLEPKEIMRSQYPHLFLGTF
ncbi:Retrotransposon gag protein [Gossypium australe]|uniref:Retrotransposon gag protein n=1 Tax=Gossypium australe TaxID=47621 RepID=A0A5B6WHL6_9ROSI|nr:Retrotransposon gag protein [Gossypium australe]